MHESTYKKLEILMRRHCFRVSSSIRSCSKFAAVAAASCSTTFSLSSIALRTPSPFPACAFAFLRNRGSSKLEIAISDAVQKSDEKSSKARQLRAPCLYAPKAYPHRAFEPCHAAHFLLWVACQLCAGPWRAACECVGLAWLPRHQCLLQVTSTNHNDLHQHLTAQGLSGAVLPGLLICLDGGKSLARAPAIRKAP